MTVTLHPNATKIEAVCCQSKKENPGCRPTTYYGDKQFETVGSSEDRIDQSLNLCGSHLKLLDSPKAFVPIFASFIHLKVAHGDRLPSSPQDARGPGIFFGNRKTTISIKEYVKRIALHSKCSPICFIGAFVYLQRLAQVSDEYRICRQSIHRLLITSVLIAAKLLDDKFYSNSFYARIGGISNKELNLLELEMLKALGFSAFISHEELSEVLNALVSSSTSNPAIPTEGKISRRNKKRGNEGEQPENEGALLPAKLQHDSKSDQVLVIAGESGSDEQPAVAKGTAASIGLSCHLQEETMLKMDAQSIPVQRALSAGGS